VTSLQVVDNPQLRQQWRVAGPRPHLRQLDRILAGCAQPVLRDFALPFLEKPAATAPVGGA
jgi:hypothetical protein